MVWVSETTNRKFLEELKDLFDSAEREGKPIDEPEGTRWINLQFSDTLANDASKRIDEILKSGAV